MTITTDAVKPLARRASLYWDCECEVGYIRPSHSPTCEQCGARREDCADSIEIEVREAGLSLETPDSIAAENRMIAMLDQAEEKFFEAQANLRPGDDAEILESLRTEAVLGWDPHFE